MASRGIGQAEMELVLRKAVKKDVEVLDWQFKPFADKVGFMGEHSTIVVQYSEVNDPEKALKTHSFFVKMVPEAERYRNFILDRGLFAKEQEMYEKILPLMEKNLGAGQKVAAAECYLVGARSYVIFDDLQRMGYKLCDKYAWLGLARCEAAFAEIALLHAGSLAAETKTGKLMAFHADHCYEALIADKKADNIVSRQWHYSSLKTTVGLLQKMQRYKSRLAAVAGGWDALYQRLYLAWEECAVAAAGNSSRFTNVISHGDLWINNVLFRDGQDGRPEAVLVDFQIYRYAPPVVDLLMFLHLTTSRQFRKEHHEHLLQFYFEKVMQALEKAGIGREEVPLTFDELKRSAEYFKTFALIIAARYLPTCLKQGLVTEQPFPAAENNGTHADVPINFVRDSSDALLEAFKNGPVGKMFEDRLMDSFDDIVDQLILSN